MATKLGMALIGILALAACGGGGGGSDPVEVDTGVCSSGLQWDGGNGSEMRPGSDCAECHRSFTISGTVYAEPDEAENCYGVEGAMVTVTGADDKQYEMTTNATGNFHKKIGDLATPYTVSVVYEGKESKMMTPQQSGRCNDCHTADGAQGASGRVTIAE